MAQASLVGDLEAWWAKGTDGLTMMRSTVLTCQQRYRWHLEKNATQMPAIGVASHVGTDDQHVGVVVRTWRRRRLQHGLVIAPVRTTIRFSEM